MGASYDLCHAPLIPGQLSRVYFRYFRQLKAFVEDTCINNQHKKAILLWFRGLVALEFVRALSSSGLSQREGP
ncbi:hypothetical protein PR202_ga23499 [Eleusine coracana subsp. coracana]|uniref:Uncharacterized protein n=1 Tax=Eleusine coracana subsp. coracana TaxID=191504 RepID=A0AAV5D5V3_ELECO|nr:hypothetical protein PR202_ga23499 [Eleusine coracana subsp. coracana]